jgi:hypothetical protein
MERPYVGILVNDRLHSQIPLGKSAYEAVHYYVEAGRSYGFVPCFFRIQDVRQGQPVVEAWVPASGRFVRKRIPVPQVIHNRAIYLTAEENRKLRRLAQDGIQLFNQRNRYSKLKIQQLLMEDPALRPHLPGTFEANRENLRTMMGMYSQLIIKPDQSSIGRGVMKLERQGSQWELTYPVNPNAKKTAWRTLIFSASQPVPSLLLRRIKQSRYILQQRLPLATFHGRPYDLRVSVQRGLHGKWKITGIVAKIAPKHLFLTNVAQGGSVCRLEQILAEEYPHLSAVQVVQAISQFSLHVAEHLSKRLPHLADLGLDVGLTTDGYPMFIECNGKDQRYSFREANMLEEWKASYYNPMGYAKYLLGRAIADNQEVDPCFTEPAPPRF